MKYTYNDTIYIIPDGYISQQVKALDITQEEACQLWLDDNDITENEEQDALDTKAKSVKIKHGAVANEPKKERKPREKKENPLKKDIISAIYEGIDVAFENYDGNFTKTIRNDEKYIDIVVNGREFTINLVEHRKKKGE